MVSKAPNPCPDCGAKDRWLGEIFPTGKVPSDVEQKELVPISSLAKMYGSKNDSAIAQTEAAGSVLRISPTGNMLANFHEGSVPCLLCPECGQLTLVTDPRKIRIL